MEARRVVILGCGRRVRDAALPAIRRSGGRFAVTALFARTARSLEADGTTYDVRALEGARPDDFAGVDLAYVAVGKDAVPGVLARLAELDVSDVDLLIETPVVRFKHFRHVGLLRHFRNAWVAEDCSELPWFDTVRAAVAGGSIGEPRGVLFQQSAYAYHALATAKSLLGAERVAAGRRRRLNPTVALRELRFGGGRRAVVLEPRDYPVGRISVLGTKGSISDFAQKAENDLLLEPIDEGGRCRGFRIGDVTTRLDDDAAELTGGAADGTSVTARMDAMKRVGFLRLLRAIDAGRGAYPVDAALEDMVVDYHLERLGYYRANPITSPRSKLGRWFLTTVTRRG